MRPFVHDSIIRFRANQALVAAAERKAQREGMTVSELMRQALRNTVKDAA